jgi:hypothetical protein
MTESPLTIENAPPVWSSRFSQYFGDLKRWVDTSAYPALALGPLSSDPSVAAIAGEIARLESDLNRTQPIPIALVGLTGVGKSTLLNALLEEEFLPVGVIGSQTAAFVTISYAPGWEVTCDYIDEAELRDIFNDAGSETDEENETGSPEARERAGKKVRTLLKLQDGDPLPAPEELRKGPPADLLDVVSNGPRRFYVENDWKGQLTAHAKGHLWPITKTIDVRGPFPMLQSGVVISDLPGAGDLNRARANQAAEAIKNAGQVLIACDGKLLQTSLMDQLEGAGRLPHRLFRDGQHVQVVLVGTSLDSKLPEPDEEPEQVRELGLDPASASTEDVFEAVGREWAKRVVPLFRDWLKVKADQFLPELPASDRAERVERIMASVVAVPTSAKDWVRFCRKKKPRVSRSPEDTGVPELQRRINQLADAQVATTVGALERRIEALKESVLNAIDRSESLLGADITGIVAALERSQSKMKEVQDCHVQVVDDLRLAVLDRFRQIRETLSDKIANAALKMAQIGQKQVHEHLADLHWASLRATVNHGGFWTTRNGRLVNLRDALGGEITRLVPQAWSRVAEHRIGKQIEDARTKALGTLKEFAGSIGAVVEEDVADELSRQSVGQLFEAGLGRAEVKLERAAKKVTDLLGNTSKDMQERVDEAVDLSVASVCADCSLDSGMGWKWRSVTRIVDGTDRVAKQAEERCTKIADDAFDALESALQSYCDTTIREMAKMGENIPVVLKNAVERSKLQQPQAQRAALDAARTSVPSSPSRSMVEA